MKKMGIVAVLCTLTAGLLAIGCGGSSGGDTCDETQGGLHVCYTYSNLTSDQATAEAAACTAGGGKTTACSSTGELGTCAVTAGGLSASVTYYSGTGVTAATAQMGCTAGGGTWTAK